MGIYFRDILLIRISRGTNNCVQRVFEKNIYFIMRFPPFSIVLVQWKVRFLWFSEPSLIIFTKGANNSDHDCIYIYTFFFFFFYKKYEAAQLFSALITMFPEHKFCRSISVTIENKCLIPALLKAQKKLSSFTAMPSSASSRHVSKGAGVWNYGGSSSI